MINLFDNIFIVEVPFNSTNFRVSKSGGKRGKLLSHGPYGAQQKIDLGDPGTGVWEFLFEWVCCDEKQLQSILPPGFFKGQFTVSVLFDFQKYLKQNVFPDIGPFKNYAFIKKVERKTNLQNTDAANNVHEQSFAEGERILIPVSAMEFNNGGNTIWIQGEGGTVLRIKCSGKICTQQCTDSPVSHADIMVDGDIAFCVSADRKNH